MKLQPSTVAREFTGVRIQVDTPISYEDILSRMKDLLGHTSIPEINALAQTAKSEAEYAREIEKRFVGKSGFMLFSEINHSVWIEIFGIHRKVIRLILGNPLLAITMIRHDLNAGLFVPVELLLTDKADGSGSSILYILPSSLIAINNNPDLIAATKVLDAKLETLIMQTTS